MTRARDIADRNVDSTTIDGVDSTQLLRSDVADTKTAGDLSFADSVKAQFGASNDLQIYHDGTHSYVQDAGTGSLRILAENFAVMNAAETENMILAVPDAAVTLMYNGNTKLQTASSGIDVTGTVTADGLTVDSSGGGLTFSGGGNTFISATSSPLIFQTSSGTERMRITGTGLVGIGDSSPDAKLDVRSTSGTTTDIGIFEAAVGGYTGTSLIAANTLGPASTYNLFECITDSDADAGGPFTEFVIRGDGNVGIGESAPEQKLHISGTFLLNNNQEIRFKDSGGNQRTAIAMSSNDLNIGTSAGGNLKFYNGSSYTERMRIDNSGDIGIGTSSITNTSNYRNIHIEGTTGTIMRFMANGTQVGQIQSDTNEFQLNAVTSDPMVFKTANTERLRITSGGLVGIGVVPSGTAKLQVNGQIYASSDGSASAPAFAVNDGDTGMFRPANNNLAFTTGGTERMRIDSSGNLSVGTSNTTVAQSNVAGGLSYKPAANFEVSGNTTQAALFNRTDTGNLIGFLTGGSSVGAISVTGSGTTYHTTSDRRLKENIEPLVATDKLMAMNPVSYTWKAFPDEPRSMGFIAQEMAEIMPEAVSTNEHNDMMSMDYGRITPVLVAALQDAHRKIEQLEQRIVEMENV